MWSILLKNTSTDDSDKEDRKIVYNRYIHILIKHADGRVLNDIELDGVIDSKEQGKIYLIGTIKET